MVVLSLTEEDHSCIGSQFLIELKNSKNFHIIPKIGVRLFDSSLSRKLFWIHIQVIPCIHPFSSIRLPMCEWFVQLLLYFLFSVLSLCYMTWFTAHLCLQLRWWSRDLFSLVSVCLQRVESVCACVWLVGGCVALWGQAADRWAPLHHTCDTNVLIVETVTTQQCFTCFCSLTGLLLLSYWSLTGLSLTHGGQTSALNNQRFLCCAYYSVNCIIFTLVSVNCKYFLGCGGFAWFGPISIL